DSDNRAYRVEDTEIAKLSLDSLAYRVEDTEIAKLSKDWHAYSVNFKPVKGSIDLKNVSGIRFEFGASTTGNPQNISISLRDIYLAKSKRFKWL
nr:hypothetical protein [Candidatus Omnitrophota bacterium]